MSIRNLSSLFKPRSMALVGASREQGSLGSVIARNLFNAGFAGPIMPVNPRYRAIEGVLTYPDAESLPEVPDLVVIATPPPTVPDLISRFAARGTRAAVIITAGFGEGGDAAGEQLRAAMLEAAGRHGMRIIGPNCIGVMVPAVGLNAGFTHIAPRPGHIAFVTQSGAVATSVLDWAAARSIGFSHVVSLGDMSDVDFGDMLDYLAREPEVRGILLYIEAVTHARKFMSAARSASRLKPVVVIKAGRHPASAGAITSHTGALAGADAVYDAAFRRAGMLRVNDIGDLFGAVETLDMGRKPTGDRLAILTNGGGIGVLAADAWLARQGRLADLSLGTKRTLDAVLPRTWSHGNPVDILGDATSERYARALDVLMHDPSADAVLVLKCPTAIGSSEDTARAVVDAVRKSKRCVLTCWLGEEAAASARRLFGAHRVPTYFTPERAVRAFSDMLSYWRNQELLTQTPASAPEEFTPDTNGARQVIARTLADGREWLMEWEAKDVLRAYDIPVVETRIAADPGRAAEIATSLGGPVVLKILSPDILHKSDLGGVMLDLQSPEAVRAAATTMLQRIRSARPGCRIDGFTVQPMVDWPQAFELIIGVSEDIQFGPVILFGHGGTDAEIVNDTALALPPLNMHLAREVMSRTRIFALLEGHRGRPAAAIDAIALTLIKVSQLIIDIGEVVELDINPLVADASGVVVLDARLRVRGSGVAAVKRLAIRPYPSELEEEVGLPDGRKFLLRPVRPEDEPAFQGLFRKLSAEDVRLRFFAPKRALSHPFAARLTQIDYDREMALVLAEPGPAGRGEVFGAIHTTADPDGERAEFAIMLRSDMVGLGFGPLLMRRMIDYAREKGLREIIGDVLRENRPMLRLCDLFRFERIHDDDEPGVVQVHLKL
jgi:acetyltransferase